MQQEQLGPSQKRANRKNKVIEGSGAYLGSGKVGFLNFQKSSTRGVELKEYVRVKSDSKGQLFHTFAHNSKHLNDLAQTYQTLSLVDRAKKCESE